MFSRTAARTVIVSLLALAGMTLGCTKGSPSGPSQSQLAVFGISPKTGSIGGSPLVQITGTGFQPGATVTLGTTATNVSVVSSTTITATAPAHATGTVDVIVTNPDGRRGQLTGGYTYADVPPASIRFVSPNTGSTGGSTPLTITGTGFQSGATVTIDGIARTVYVANSTTIFLSSPAHAAGTVDVVVTNPGGQADRLTGGYTYASPESFDFNGSWVGGAGSEYDYELGFTIQNNLLTSVSCAGSTIVPLSPAAPISNGEFSFVGDEGVRISGRIVSAVSAVGTINLGSCSSTNWITSRSQ